MSYSVEISDRATLRLLTERDVAVVLAAYLRNREHLAPWDPARLESFFTSAEQSGILTDQIEQLKAGSGIPFVIVKSETIIGRINLTGIVRGPFQSANVGYWVDKEHVGQGLASAALENIISYSIRDLGLHRLQAGTLLHNLGSQKVLRKAGFEPIGIAKKYLKIAGTWQDHLLFQRILSE
ncbi:GNAT family N-acetyltransferase [Frigoribacterium sp. CG_9.8]|uniref:GNAT family N-acetyltransferase n=1 Tax=Frigoribacterium sp. CG_9.8 TaxID=2787733 RepID=UPI0018CA7268|nr:GNAT family N-acetyltransferase [Frigoribacterium sp. CG_9.8]MBG6107110.1 ribosomal-protein-alanine N-acetyltransferase [Frigoribacterium sp. CG_9.8]